jgi:hypothetical protein
MRTRTSSVVRLEKDGHDPIGHLPLDPDADIIFEHARCGGFPANRVSEISQVIDPSTAGVA